jgi:hypothetical protein
MWRREALTSPTNKPIRAKALLAIAFAGSVLTSQPPAFGQKSPQTPSSSSVEAIAKYDRATPEERAYYLLLLANCYITGGDAASLEANLRANLGKLSNARLFQSSRGENRLVSWANSASLQSYSAGLIAKGDTDKKKFSSENRARADKAIGSAIAQLSQSPENTETLNLFLIASCLSKITGNTQNELKYTKVLNEAIQACEADETVDSVQIKLISSILNSMAYGLVPFRMNEYQAHSPVQQPAIDMKHFDECERLKLRAAALLDRLPTTDHDRRKAHRDLTLWYAQLGKGDKSLKEKQELFNLVGVKDDRILYPQSGMCGHVVWWSVPKQPNFTMDCGMG